MHQEEMLRTTFRTLGRCSRWKHRLFSGKVTRTPFAFQPAVVDDPRTGEVLLVDISNCVKESFAERMDNDFMYPGQLDATTKGQLIEMKEDLGFCERNKDNDKGVKMERAVGKDGHVGLAACAIDKDKSTEKFVSFVVANHCPTHSSPQFLSSSIPSPPMSLTVAQAKGQVRLLGNAIRGLKPDQATERQTLVQQIQHLEETYLKSHYAEKLASSQKAHEDASKGSRCQFRINAKNRFCKYQPVAGTVFCPIHTEFSERNGQKRKRVPCPLNPTHSIYEHDVEQHVLICPDRPRADTRSFYAPSANRGSSSTKESSSVSTTSSSSSSSSEPSVNLRDPDAVRMFNAKVCRLLERAQQSRASVEPRPNELTPVSCQKHLEDAANITSTTAFNMGRRSINVVGEKFSNMIKHARQIASIVGNIEEAQLSSRPEDTAFVELGAGKGTLSCMLSETAGRGGSFVLVDRGTGFRNKSDKRIRKAAGSFERHTMDIADLKLASLPGVSSKSECVLVSKHLCGVATCFSLRSAVAMKRDTAMSSSSSAPSSCSSTRLRGMALATCCHHLCNWDDYVNRAFFIEGGFTEGDFNTVLRMTSWAVSGFGTATTAEYKEEKTDLRDDEKREYGKRCKTALDVGRLLYLESNGFQCEIVQYIDRAITPENRLLVGSAV